MSTQNNNNLILCEKIIKELKALQSESGTDFLSEILDVFTKSSKQRIDQLTIYSESKNIVGFKFELHALKSSALTIGASKLSEYCQKYEKDPELETKLDNVLLQIKYEMNNVLNAIKRLNIHY